jgi:hypothetical protein
MSCDIPGEVIQFVRKHIRSLEQLEILVLLQGSRAREWSADDMDAVIRSTPESIGRWLEQFVQIGLVARTSPVPTYRYAPANAELERAAIALAAAYKLSRHRIIELVYSPGPSAIKSFSAAFRLRRDQPE